MKNNIQAIDSDRLKTVSTQFLKENLAASLEFTAKHLVYMGMLWRELESRGEDLSELKKGISVYIPMIAYNKIEAQLVVNYAGQKTLLMALSDLSKESQKRLINNPKISVVEPETNNVEILSLIDMPARYVHQIFNKNKIRNVDEQKTLLSSYKGHKRMISKTRKARKVYIDSNTNRLIVSSYHVEISELKILLKKYEKSTKT